MLYGKSDVAVLDKDVRRERYLEEAELVVGKAETGSGWIEGYASIFDVVDLGGEVVRPGAFTKTIAERVAAGKVKIMAQHMAYGGDALDVVGTITVAKEDDRGLWIHAELASTDFAQEIRKLVDEKHLSGLSIGYKPIRWEEKSDADGRRIFYLLEVKLMEVTLTARPMNDDARVTASKSLTDEIASLVEVAGTDDDGRQLSDEEVARATGLLGKLDGAREQLVGLLAKSQHSDDDDEAEPTRFMDAGAARRRLSLARARARAASI